MCSKIKEENEEKEKEGEKKEIVNGIYKPYILIEWRFVNWSILIYNIPLIFILYIIFLSWCLAGQTGLASLHNSTCNNIEHLLYQVD